MKKSRSTSIKSSTLLFTYLTTIQQTLKEELTLNQLSFLLLVAEGKSEDMTLKEMGKLAGFASGAGISRAIRVLAKGGTEAARKNRPGLDLVEFYMDPQNNRVKRARLTRKGERLFQVLDVLTEKLLSRR